MRLVGLLVGAVVLFAGCGGSVIGNVGGGSVGPNDWVLEGATPDGEHIVVSTLFGGVASGCTRFEGWEVNESESAVEITARLWRRHAPSDCTDEGVVELLQVDLDAPLGDRRLAGCGQDDCRATVTEGGQLSVGQVVATTGALAIAGPQALTAYSTDGELVATIAGPSSGHVLALAGDVVVHNDGIVTMAVDLLSGEELWRTTGRATAVFGDVVYLCRGQDSDGLAAVDATTGKDLWATDLACESLVAHGERLTIVAHDPNTDGGHLLLVVDAATGELISSEPFFDGYDDRVGGFDRAIAIGSTTLVTGFQANLVVLDKDGHELDRQPRGLGYAMGQVDGIAILGHYDRVVGYDPATASELWTQARDAFATIAPVDGSVWSLDRAEGTVSRLDPQTGASVWTAPIGLTTSFDVAAGSNTAYVLTTQTLFAIDNNTGEINWSQHHPYDDAG